MASVGQSLNDLFIDLSVKMGILYKHARASTGDVERLVHKNSDNIRSAHSALLRADVSELAQLTITFVPNLMRDISPTGWHDGSARETKAIILVIAKSISHALPKYIEELGGHQPRQPRCNR
jgi:hypothetical protein